MSVILIWKYLSARKRREITDSAHRSGGLRQPVPHLPLSRRRPISQLLTRYDVTLVDTEYDCEQFLAEKVPRAPVIIGLDCEWVNREGVSSAPVALLQLSFPNGRCLLARVFKMTALGPRLTDLLTDKRSLSLSLSPSLSLLSLTHIYTHPKYPVTIFCLQPAFFGILSKIIFFLL